MSSKMDAATQVARDYYNSEDADRFYATIWGGEDIHVGMYESPDQEIREASRATVDHLANRLTGISADSTILDLGSGYGGAARRLVEKFGCNVICLNLAETENTRCRALNEQAGMASKIQVVDGSFENVPVNDMQLDAAWSQDAILHAGNRTRVLQEVNRVLKPGGQFVFTDPMQSDDCPAGVLQPILERIHLSDLGSPSYYRQIAKELGWHGAGFEDHSHQLVQHYSRVLLVTQREFDRLVEHISPDYLSRMQRGLQHWIHGGEQGHLSWGVFEFQKP